MCGRACWCENAVGAMCGVVCERVKAGQRAVGVWGVVCERWMARRCSSPAFNGSLYHIATYVSETLFNVVATFLWRLTLFPACGTLSWLVTAHIRHAQARRSMTSLRVHFVILHWALDPAGSSPA
jgi:hypothetical protein